MSHPHDTIHFLLKEYEVLQENRKEIMRVQEARLTVYLTVVGGAITALTFTFGSVVELLQTDQYPHLMPVILFTLAFSLIALGWLTYVRMIERGIETVAATRRMFHIKSYFAALDPTINVILPHLRDYDDPKLGTMGFITDGSARWVGLPMIIAILNSAIVTIGVSLWFRLPQENPNNAVYNIGLITFLISMAVHLLYENRRVNMVKAQYDVFFGSGDLISQRIKQYLEYLRQANISKVDVSPDGQLIAVYKQPSPDHLISTEQSDSSSTEPNYFDTA